MRRDITEQCGLVAQHRKVRDRRRAVSDRDCQIDEHSAAVMSPPALLGRCHRRRQPGRESQPIGQIGEQSGPGMVHQAGAATGHPHPRSTLAIVHHESALSGWSPVAFDSTSFPNRKGVFADADPFNPQPLLNRLG